MIRVQCAHCALKQDIQATSCYLVDLAGPHLHWTCHGTHERRCDAVNVQAVPRNHTEALRALVGELRQPALLAEHRADLMPKLTEDEALEVMRALHGVDHLAPLAARRLPGVVTA